jgi:hypothetical protein
VSSIYPYAFETEVERFGVGKDRKIWYNVLFLPSDLKLQLPFQKYPRLRVEGEIADVPVANAFIPAGDGRSYVIVSPKVLKDAQIAIGDRVEMRFQIADQDFVDIPEDLKVAVDRDPAVKKAWDSIPSGRKRMAVQHVISAKTAPTRARRMNEALDALLHFGGDLNAWRRSKRV